MQVISEIIETCRAHDFTDVILVHEHRGVPDGLIISHLPFGPTAYFGLMNVVSSNFLFIESLDEALTLQFYPANGFVLLTRLRGMTSKTKKQLAQCQRHTRI